MFNYYVLINILYVKYVCSFNVQWQDGYNVGQAIPRDVIVDLINNFGLELLQVCFIFYLM